ncbi:MAG: PQQ-binding-like beta-propeller repeat protein [Candidatus Bathyarchaeota archaeon]|nr:PQQ-binding-like beta-propeller repeat protein [Candidatus Bathyarchaeota archaeon]
MNKKLSAMIIFVLIAAMAIPLGITNFSAEAQTTTYTNMQEGGSIPLPAGVTPDSTLSTISHLSFNPNPVGVNQSVTAFMWLSPPTHASRYLSNFTLVITDPSGNKEVITKETYRADTTSWATFTPDEAGTWKIEFIFPGAYYPTGNYTVAGGGALGSQVTSFTQSVYYKPSSDGPYNLTVQAEPVAIRPESALPADYWERPIASANREWWSILGYYPATGVVGNPDDDYWPDETNPYMSNYKYLPYVQGPESAHVVWKKQYAIGGLADAIIPRTTWTSLKGGSPSIIYAGRCYETIPKSINGVATNVWTCYDLRTGKTIWEQPGITQIPTMVTFNTGYGDVPGADPQWGRRTFLTYVGGGRCICYDPFTGAVATGASSTSPYNVSIAPLTTGTLYANLDYPYFLSVQDLGASAAPNRYRLVNWTVKGDYGLNMATVNVGFRVMSNISWPYSSLSSLVDYEAGVAVTSSSGYNAAMGASIDANLTAVDIYTGQVLWTRMADVPYNVWPASVADHGKVAVRFEDGYFYCWDIKNGKFLWKSEMSSWPWGTFGAYDIASYGGNIIFTQYDGVAAYDWDTGEVSWLYQAKEKYPYDSPYQDNYPFFCIEPLIADGKVYAVNTEHTPTEPLTRGWELHCINATSGEGIWSMPSMMEASPGVRPCAIADGYLVNANGLDGITYCYGKGKSQTTVSAPSTELTVGQKFTITGTVLDMSPAQEGTAAISDESMSAWMQYLHMQASKPTNATGVSVTLTAIDPNNNVINIGTATSDTNGVYGLTWAPEVSGMYNVIASFAGSDSYGSSVASTYFTATDAPAATPQPTAAPASIADAYFIPAVAGIIVAIFAVGAILAILMLKKRP